MRHIKRRALAQVSAVLPPKPLVCTFNDLVGPMDELRISLVRENSLLASTRDLLLPRLVSGQIDVEGLRFKWRRQQRDPGHIVGRLARCAPGSGHG